MSDGPDSIAVKVGLSALIVVLMVPGLVIEPGPFSEIAGIAGLAAVWGLDWDTGGGN